jgi:hypothetical protein
MDCGRCESEVIDFQTAQELKNILNKDVSKGNISHDNIRSDIDKMLELLRKKKQQLESNAP